MTRVPVDVDEAGSQEAPGRDAEGAGPDPKASRSRRPPPDPEVEVEIEREITKRHLIEAVSSVVVVILSAISVGASRSLIERAADVALKERRKLVLVPRETPLSSIHLQNMLRLSRAGAVVLPAAPGFYGRPTAINELVDFVAARVLDQLSVPHTIGKRWDGQKAN